MTNDSLSETTIVAFIGDIFERRGADSYLGEQVTMSEHMLQSALLAETDGAAEELIAAALLHDIGHYTSEFGENSFDEGIDNHHDEAGARVLRGHFPRVVIECVRLHVDAKRYLCATDPGYFAKLSEASVHTLAVQGGPMCPSEIAEFEKNPFYREAVRVRVWDDGSKIPSLQTHAFVHYAPILQRVVDRHHAELAVRPSRADDKTLDA
jgi:phosphonate degradation associated HDIG domain protein